MNSGRSASTVNVERFWCLRDSSCTLDGDGFLRDPDDGWFGKQSANPGVLRTDDLSDQRCLVLLGEPGAGKSTAVRTTSRLVAEGVLVQSFDLADYGSEDTLVREVFDHPSILDWMAGAGRLCLVLDSLDEAQARVPHLGRVIANRLSRLPRERLFVRFACRTANWPAGLEQSLKKLFGEVAVVEILPLRRADAASIAAAWCDPSRLLDEVAQAGVGPLAARPLTLRFLARGSDHSGTLPERGAALYAAGIRSLCDEQNPDRLDAGLGGALSLDQRVAVARRIAVATVFGGASAVWTGPEVAARNSEDISVEQLAGSTEPTPRETITLTVPAVLEALRTGLFTSRGEQRLGWAHATFADFLAADWVVANELSVTQARSLFLGPDGRCWPQTRLAAAWAVAIAPERFGFLTAADPAAFQGEVELPSDALRAAVIEGLFSNASKLTGSRWERSYHALRHPEVAGQIRPRLHDPDLDRRRLALDLADECASIELRDDLVAIALNTTAERPDRVAAGWALSRLEGRHRTAALRSLALNDDMRGDDPADELKGVALLASWPQAMSNAEVFSVLTPRRRRNLHGSYAVFLDRFRDGITEVDFRDGLQWLLDDLNAPAGDHVLGALANRLLRLAANRPTDPVVVEAFTRLVIARAERYERLLFEEFRHDEPHDPLADPMLRRAVATAVLGTEEASKLMQNVMSFTSDYLGVVRAEDLSRLAEIYTEVDGNKRDVVRSLFHLTFDAGNADHLDLVLAMPHHHPLYLDLVHSWVEPVELGSSKADEMRRSWEMTHRPRRAKTEKDDDVNEQIEELLTRFDEGDAMGFWYSTRLLTVAPGSKHFGAEFDPDVVGMKRWPTLSERIRGRLVHAADRYLRSHR